MLHGEYECHGGVPQGWNLMVLGFSDGLPSQQRLPGPHVAANGAVPSCSWLDHIVSIRSSTAGHRACLHALAAVSSAAVNRAACILACE